MSSINAELAKTGEGIIAAAIEWRMAELGFSLQDGLFVNAKIQVTPPTRNGGGGVVSQRGNGGRAEFPDNLDPRTDVYLKIRNRVQHDFKRWFFLADPQGFKNAADRMREAATTLASQAQVSGDQFNGGNPALGDMHDMHAELAPFNGQAIDTFTRNYSSRLPSVVAGQCAVATVLGITLTAEQRIFEAARRDVLSIAHGARSTMENYRGSGGNGALGTVISVGGAVASAATIFITGGTAAPFVAGASTVLGIVGDFLPEGGATHKTAFSAGDWESVMDKVRAALQTLDNEMEARERDLSEKCYRLNDRINRHRDSFDLAPPTGVLHATDPSRLGALDPSGSAEIKADLRTLDTIATKVMPALSDQFLIASRHVTESIDSSIWLRKGGAGFSPAGYGTVGAYNGWRLLNDNLRQILDDTKWEIVKAGDHLHIATKLLRESDEAVQKELAAHTREVSDGSGASHHNYAAERR